LLLALALFVSADTVLRNETQVYTRYFTPVVCGQSSANLTVWRELAVYNTTRIENGVAKTVYYTTITLYLRNDARVPFKNFFLNELLPESVAKTADELVGFSLPPDHFEKGSVVVSWLFESVEPGETKSVSYTVEKKLDERVLDEYEAPRVVAAGAELPGGGGAQQAAPQTDYTPLVLVVLMGLVAGLVYYFSRRQA